MARAPQQQEEDKVNTMEQEVVRSEGQRVGQKQTRERIPFGVPRSKLSVAVTIPGYHLHWINDTAGRISQAEQGGYEFVDPQEVGETSTETRKRVLVGRDDDGSPLYAYLMKIKEEWYEEAQNQINSIQDRFDAAIRGGTLTSGDHRYIPKEGIKISRN